MKKFERKFSATAVNDRGLVMGTNWYDDKKKCLDYIKQKAKREGWKNYTIRLFTRNKINESLKDMSWVNIDVGKGGKVELFG